MFLKRVIIYGFKAFGDKVTFESLSKCKNCIFGLNGSGKSTFYNAIEFVLLDDFTHLRPFDRKSLLHNGCNTGFVELTFDNTSRRIPIDMDEVSLRRSIGLQKDEFFINRKHSTSNEIANLLETAGISLKSGIFIVKQGSVKEIAEMTEESRLQLLFEVTGIRTYDEQREESIKLMGEANIRKEKIENSIKEIEVRLDKLQEETEELRAFEDLDRERKTLELMVYNIDCKNADEAIITLTNKISKENSVVYQLRIEL